MKVLAAALLIIAGASARAEPLPAPPPPEPAAQRPTVMAEGAPPPPDRPLLLGLQLGAGVPDGLALSLAVRPYTPYLRLNAGLAWNYFGFGLTGGVTVLPLHARLTPTFTFEGGTYFASDLSSPLDRVHLPDAYKDAARSAGMRYLAGMVGLEMGGPDRLAFFVRAGVTRIWYTLSDVRNAPAGTTTRIDITDAGGAANVPAFVLGFSLYL